MHFRVLLVLGSALEGRLLRCDDRLLFRDDNHVWTSADGDRPTAVDRLVANFLGREAHIFGARGYISLGLNGGFTDHGGRRGWRR